MSRRLHLEILGMALVGPKDSATKTFAFQFPRPRFRPGRATEEGVVKLNRPTNDMGIVPLSHGPSEPSQNTGTAL